MPTLALAITVDTLRAALTSPTVQSQVSATDLFNALKIEVRNLERLHSMFLLSSYFSIALTHK
jgi:hypothetical protein